MEAKDEYDDNILEQFSSYSDIISLDTLLISLDYKIINKIFTNEFILVKCVNPNGNKAYILNDLKLPTSLDPNYKLNVIDSINISYSFKIGCYNTIDNTCIGVLFELSDGFISTMIRGDDLKPIETNYNLSNLKSLEKIDDLSIVTYPIITISDISENPDDMLKYTDVNIIKFKNDQLSLQTKNLNDMFEGIIEAHDKFEEFRTNKNNVIDKLNYIMLKLIKWNEICRTSYMTNDEDKDKCNSVRKNIEIRNNEANNIIKVMGKIAKKKEELKLILKELDDANEFIKECCDSVEHMLLP